MVLCPRGAWWMCLWLWDVVCISPPWLETPARGFLAVSVLTCSAPSEGWELQCPCKCELQHCWPRLEQGQAVLRPAQRTLLSLLSHGALPSQQDLHLVLQVKW